MTALVLALALALAAEPEPPAKVPYFKTPQAVFDAGVKAMLRKDAKLMAECVAPAVRREYAASLAIETLMMLAAGGDEAKAAKPRLDVMAKHGLGEKALKGLVAGFEGAAYWKTLKALMPLIKKPESFIVDMTAAELKMLEGLGQLAGVSRMTLADLKVDGPTAEGFIVWKDGGPGARQKVGFTRGPGGWRMIPYTGPITVVIEVRPAKD